MAKKPEPAAAQQNTEQAATPAAPTKDFFLKKYVPWDDGGKDDFVIFKLGNGSVIECQWSKIPPDMQKRLGYHGLSQKIGDATAGASKARDFATAYDNMTGLWESILQNAWNVKGDGTSSADLAKALAAIKNISVEVAEAAIAKMDDEQLAKVRSHPSVKLKVQEIRTERAKLAAAAAKPEDLVIPGLP